MIFSQPGLEWYIRKINCGYTFAVLGMNWYNLWISFGVLCIYCLKKTEQCSPPDGWWPMQPERRAEKAEIVVFGTVVSIPQRNNSSQEEGRFYTVRLHVHCIVKGSELPPFIHVAGFSDFSGGLCVHSKAFLNTTYVLFVEPDVDNPKGFRVLEVNLQRGAVHPGHKLSVLREIVYLTGENASLPTGVKNDTKPGCPHFPHKRKFRDPAPHRVKQNKPCRCRRKKQKHKKRKRTKGNSWTRTHWMDITEIPTLPRTRRYSVINFEQDKVARKNILPPSGETVSLTTSSGSLRLVTKCFWWLLTVHCLVRWRLPT